MPNDARPAEPFTVEEALALDRVEAIGRNARAIWLGLLGYLAFAGLTLFTVRDVDFFSAASGTTLPIVNVAIPTTNFFWAAPWLGVVLHAYLHLYLEKLWDALAEAPTETAGKPLGDRIFPWLVNDWALRRRPDRPIIKRPLGWLGDLVTTLVVWIATPLVIAAFWWRSMPAHLPWLTLMIAGALMLALYVSLSGWRRARAVLAKAGSPPAEEQRRRWLRAVWRGAVATIYFLAMPVALAALVMLSVARTGDTLAGINIDVIPLAPIDLVGAEIVVKPDDWVSREVAERRFRAGWCRDRELPADACAPPTEAHQESARERWCDDRRIEVCVASFAAIDEAFRSEWLEERWEYLANLTRPDLRGRDLRRASANGAFLAGIDLSDARLEGADLSLARLEGANLNSAQLAEANLGRAQLEAALLVGARLEGANLRNARLDRADLTKAWLQRSDLSFVLLEGAQLEEALMEGVDLRWARLEGADLSFVGLDGANLGGALLTGAVLIGSRLDGAMLMGPNQPYGYAEPPKLRGAQLSGAQLNGLILHGALMEGASLDGTQLQGADLSGALLEGASLSGARLEEANFTRVLLKGVDLSGAQLSRANLLGAVLEGSILSKTRDPGEQVGQPPITSGFSSPFSSADLSAVKNLTQDQLIHVIGDDDTVLPLDAETGEQLHVWTCWEKEAAETFVQLQTRHRDWPTADDLWEDIRDNAWICAEGMEPLPVLGKR